MLSNSSANSASSELHLDLVFRALGDRTRRQLLARLTEGSAMVTELAKPFEMSLPAVGKHLRVLERAGLVHRTIDGRVITGFLLNQTPNTITMQDTQNGKVLIARLDIDDMRAPLRRGAGLREIVGFEHDQAAARFARLRGNAAQQGFFCSLLRP